MTDDKQLFVEFARAVMHTFEETKDMEFKVDDIGTDTQLKKLIDPKTGRIIYCLNCMVLTTNEKARKSLVEIFDALIGKSAKEYYDFSKKIRIHSRGE